MVAIQFPMELTRTIYRCTYVTSGELGPSGKVKPSYQNRKLGILGHPGIPWWFGERSRSRRKAAGKPTLTTHCTFNLKIVPSARPSRTPKLLNGRPLAMYHPRRMRRCGNCLLPRFLGWQWG
jgi:hypothetical protein